jgi:TonB family protein
VRCADCETEPLSPRYCECCGREIALHLELAEAEEAPLVSEQVDEVDPVSGPDDWAPNPNPTSDLRYQASPALISIDETVPTTAPSNGAAPNDQPAEKTVSPSTTSTASSQEPSDRTTVAKSKTPQALPEATMPPVKDDMAVAKAAGTEAEKTREALPKRPRTDPLQAENVRRPSVVTSRPTIPASVPVLTESQNHSTKFAIALLVIGAMVVGAPWLRTHKESVVARAKQLVSGVLKDRVTEVADAGDHSAPIEAPAAAPMATEDRESALPKERPAVPTTPTPERKPATMVVREASTPIRPKPVTPARPPRPAAVKAVVTKPVRAKEPTREVPAAPVLAAKPSAPVIAAPVVEVVAAAPAAPPPVVGPFFESNQVNESPRVVTRAEPRLPDELRDRSIKEVVVVRALVSQSGHPSRVSLLRRSKTGPQLDDVVVAAVNQWTFSPARKKGEAVSCWFNFAVPIGQ